MMNYAPFRQSALTFLAIGAVVGLILGLLIGWVFWPVEWTGATLQDLDDAARAEYIATVADAFVIYDSPEAAAVAQRRLAALDDGNLEQAVNAALAYFSTSPFSDKAIRDSNIRRLAVALNLSPADGAAPLVLPTTDVAAQATPTAEAVAATPTTAESSGRLGWVGWLLWFITAVILLGGGLYILNHTGLSDLQSLWKGRAAQKRPDDEVDEFDAPNVNYRTSDATVGQPGVDYSFDQEDFDQDDDHWQAMAPPSSTRLRSQDTPAQSDNFVRRSAAHADDSAMDADEFAADEFADGDFGDDTFDEDDFAEEEYDAGVADRPISRDAFDDEEDQTTGWRPSNRSYSIDVPPGASTPIMTPTESKLPERNQEQPALPRVDRADTQTRPGATTAPTASNSASVRAPENKRSERPATTARPRTKVIDQHTFRYQLGMAEYEASRPIVDPQSQRYVGEFGMSASSKGGTGQAGAEQPVALEVWLFDKADERNVGSQTRILLSEYAVDHNLDQLFLKERQDNPRPFTAQPGIHFQVESQNFLLDCTIVEVEYSTNNATKGLFQKITVETTVQQKG